MEENAITTSAEVVDVDGERLGKVIAATEEYIVAEQGFFFPTDFYIPRTVIDEVKDGIVRLSMSKAQVLAQGWSVQPDVATTSAEGTTGR